MEEQEHSQDSSLSPRQGLESRRLSASGVLLLVALAALCGLRFRHLDHDLPYNIVSASGSFVTDEGWYNKSAQLLIRYGQWRSELDFSFYSHTPLYVLLMSSVFWISGIGIATARAVSVVAFLASLVVLYRIYRTSQPRMMALLGCTAVSATMSVVTYSRMAIIEPVGIAFSLPALLIWIRHPRQPGWCLLSMMVAASAIFLKISFVFTFVVVGGLWMLDCLHLARHRRWRQSAALAVTVVAVAAAAGWTLLEIRDWAAQDWTAFSQGSAIEEAANIDFLRIVDSEFKALRYRSRDRDKVVLFLTLAIVLPGLFFRRSSTFASLVADRAALAMVLWAAAGFVLFSSIPYQPPRYYYFLVYPLTFLVTWCLQALLGRRRGPPVAAFVLALHLIWQVPSYQLWFSRQNPESYSKTARHVVATVTNGRDQVVLLGLNSAFVSFFSDRIRPLEVRPKDPSILCRRIEHWRPEFVMYFTAKPLGLKDLCPNLIEQVTPLKNYLVMPGGPYGSHMVLASLHYISPVEPSENH
jgi:4-amino-4-deoxy-L-arabinose transferase-like glycosyltransferase